MPIRETPLGHEDDPDPEDHLVQLLWSLDEELISGQAEGEYGPAALAGDLDPQAANGLMHHSIRSSCSPPWAALQRSAPTPTNRLRPDR